MNVTSGEVTRLLKAWNGGDATALPHLVERVHAELHRIARRCVRNERRADTLQPTALINEAYLRLADVAGVDWHERAQLFALAAQVMRRILVDAARARAAGKRGGGAQRVTFDDSAIAADFPERSMLALNDALTAFAQAAPRQARVVELRWFGGLGEDEIASVLDVSARTVRRDWDFAKAWLSREISSG